MTRPRVAIVGGGITGLVAARKLQEQFDVTVFEASSQPGGKIETTMFRGHAIDTGPDAFITRNRAAVQLVSELGLADQLIAPSARSAAVFARGALRPFPKGLALGIPTNAHALSRSGIVSYAGSVRALADRALPWRIAPKNFFAESATGRHDPSVASVIGPRVGKEVVSMLVDPLIGGINASDVAELSFAAALPQFVEKVAGKRGLMSALADAQSSHPPLQAGGVAVTPAPIFNGIAGGLSQLIDALVASATSLAVAIRCNAKVEHIAQEGNGGWAIDVSGAQERFDAVVLAVPAFAAAALLQATQPAVAALCDAIAFSSVATVTSAWRRDVVVGRLHSLRRGVGAKPLANGDPTQLAGVLIPRSYGHLATAISMTTTKWPASTAPDEFVIRCSVGRHGDDRSLQLTDEQLIAAVREDLKAVVGLTATPLQSHVSRYEKAFPQYTVGHLARVTAIEKSVEQLPGLFLTGASYRGIGIPACIDAAVRTVAMTSSFLSSSH